MIDSTHTARKDWYVKGAEDVVAGIKSASAVDKWTIAKHYLHRIPQDLIDSHTAKEVSTDQTTYSAFQNNVQLPLGECIG